MRTKSEVAEHLFFTEYKPDSIPFIREYVEKVFGYNVLIIKRAENGHTFGEFLSWAYDVEKSKKEPSSRWGSPTFTVKASVMPKKEMAYQSKLVIENLEEIISYLKEEESLPLHLVKAKSMLELCIDAIKKYEGVC